MATTTNETATTKHTTREPLAHVCGVTIAPARVGTVLGKNGLNEESQKVLDDLQKQKEDLKKMGAPAVPAAPAKDAPKLTETESTARKQAQKEFKEFKSNKYERANEKYAEWKGLKKNRTELEKEVKKMERLAAYDGEDPEKIRQRDDAIANLPGQKTALDRLVKEMDAFEKDNAVNIFIQYDIASKKRIRINREANVAVASILQEIIEQIAYCTMEQANEEGKKIIVPLHSLGSGHNNIPLFPLMFNLRAYKKLCEYKEAVLTWEEDCKKFDVRVKNEAKKRNVNIKDHRAHKKDQRPQKPTPEKYCPTNGQTTDFKFYVGQIFVSLRDVDSEKFSDLRVSNDIKVYLSNLAMDFCNRLVPWIKHVIKCRNIKTVGWEVIMSAVELMLIDGGSEYFVKDLRGTVKERVDKLRDYNARKKSRGEHVDDEEEEEDDDDQAEAVEATNTERRRRGRKVVEEGS